jgi:hypothetical protein
MSSDFAKTIDHLFRGSLEELDPDVYELTQFEAERQYRKLILIASPSRLRRWRCARR